MYLKSMELHVNLELASGAKVNLYCDSNLTRRTGIITFANDCPRQLRGPSANGIYLLAFPVKSAGRVTPTCHSR